MLVASSEESFLKLFDQGLLWAAEKSAAILPSDALSLEKQHIPCTTKLHFAEESPFEGLSCGALHEWSYKKSGSLPPFFLSPSIILSYLAGLALERKEQALRRVDTPPLHHIIWLGKECWPTAHILEKTVGDISRCIFVDPPNQKLAFWALEKIVASPATAAVIAPYSSNSLSLSRRFALLAERSGALVLLVRPSKDFSNGSSAKSRWRIAFEPSDSEHPRFRLELHSWKGMQPRQREWVLECRTDEKVSLYIPSALSLRPSQAEISSNAREALPAYRAG